MIVNYSIGGFAGDYGQMSLIAKGLQKLGHEVTIVVTDGDGFYFDKAKSKSYSTVRKKLLDARGKTIMIDEIPTYPIHCLTPKIGMYCPSAAKTARKIIADYDIVYAINWYHHLAMVFSKIAYECGVPFVIAAMGSLQQKARLQKGLQKRIADKLYTKNMIMHASGFHSVGNSETLEYINLGADPSKIYLIDHGLVINNFKIKNRTGVLERFGLEAKGNQYLVTIGRIDPKKGLEILLNAFSKILKVHNKLSLVIVGTGTDNYVQKIKQMAHDLNLDSSVVFTGFVTDDEKLELLESAVLFVATSHSDVHTAAALEALAMGLPVVTTKASDFPEIDEYNAGVTVDTDVNSVYQALLKLLDTDTLLSEYSRNARKLVENKFLIENQIKKYEQMFLDVIQKSKQANPRIIKK